MNQPFEAPAPEGGSDWGRRKSWVLGAEGSWAEGWVWLSVGKAQSDAVTAGWGLGVLVPREATAQGHTTFGAGLAQGDLQPLICPPCLCWQLCLRTQQKPLLLGRPSLGFLEEGFEE